MSTFLPIPMIGVIVVEMVSTVALKCKIHYALQRTFHIPVPCLRRWVPVFGGKSLIELVLVIAVASNLLLVGFNSPKKTVALLADVISGVAIVFGLRDSQVRMILRSEVVVFWHKVFAFLTLVFLILHCLQVGVNLTGLLMAASTLSVPIAFLFYRFGLFKHVWFHWYHVVTLVVFFVASIFHGTTAIYLLTINYVVSNLRRYIATANFGTAQIVRVSEEVAFVQVAVPLHKPLGFTPGQHYAIDVPALDPDTYRRGYHGFSVIPAPRREPSATDDDFQRLCFYMRQVGPWTTRLYNLGVDSASRGGPDLAGAKQHYVKLEGPHGFVSVDYSDADLYPTLLLVAEDVYVAPALSILADLVDKRSTRQKVVFVWAVRDADLAVDVSQRILRPLLQHEQYDPSAAAAMETTNVLHASASVSSSERLSFSAMSCPPDSSECAGGDSSTEKGDASSSGLQLETRVFLTGEVSSSALEQLRLAGWCRGQPSMRDVVRDVVESTSGQRPRAAVIVCGPDTLVEEVRDLCDHEVYVSRVSGERVVVDCHEDSFDS